MYLKNLIKVLYLEKMPPPTNSVAITVTTITSKVMQLLIFSYWKSLVFEVFFKSHFHFLYLQMFSESKYCLCAIWKTNYRVASKVFTRPAGKLFRRATDYYWVLASPRNHGDPFQLPLLHYTVLNSTTGQANRTRQTHRYCLRRQQVMSEHKNTKPQKAKQKKWAPHAKEQQ